MCPVAPTTTTVVVVVAVLRGTGVRERTRTRKTSSQRRDARARTREPHRTAQRARTGALNGTWPYLTPSPSPLRVDRFHYIMATFVQFIFQCVYVCVHVSERGEAAHLLASHYTLEYACYSSPTHTHTRTQ